MRRRVALFALALIVAAPLAARAVQPDEMLRDPQMEQRAREISAGVRCMVCQNENIDDSNAPLARDLRLLVRERLQKGDSDDQVRDYLVARDGNELTALLARVLADPHLAATLAHQGRQAVLAGHTAAHRVRTLLGLAQNLPAAQVAIRSLAFAAVPAMPYVTH